MTVSVTSSKKLASRHLPFSRDEPLVETLRGGFVETVHRGSIAVSDASGSLLHAVGDGQERVFLRSGAKPFQVMPAVLLGAIERFGITDRELAVLCASHSGEPRHVEAVESVLHKIGLDEGALRCGLHPPLNSRAAADRWRNGLEPSAVCNNCSGAHAGMLAACVAAGWSVDDYGDPEHPLQARIRNILLEFSGAEKGEMEEAVDNCTVPTFRLPLLRAATAFARLASGSSLPLESRRAAETVRRAMTSYPEMVGGEHRLDSDLMRVAAGALVAKGGAGGFQGLGHTGRGIGVTLKVSDGNSMAAEVATMQAISDLSLLSSDSLAQLSAYGEPESINLRGETVGRVVAVFDLGGKG